METSTGDRTRKVTGNIVKDVDRFTKNLARWAKYEIYDQGGKCEFYGLRLVKTSSFCITRLKHNFSLIAWTVSAGTFTTATAPRSIAQSTSVTSTTGPPMASLSERTHVTNLTGSKTPSNVPQRTKLWDEKLNKFIRKVTKKAKTVSFLSSEFE